MTTAAADRSNTPESTTQAHRWIHPVAAMREADPVSRVVVALVLFGALLRVPTLGVQSLWYDEGHTFVAIHGSFSWMLNQVYNGETTPPVYFALAWVWAHVVGYGVFGIRLISAVAGILVIPIAFFAGRRLASPRAGVIAAALVAFNPMLIWYSQEARAYAMMVLLSSVALLAFVELLDEVSRRWVVVWALSGGVGLATHYFTALALIPEAAWLLRRHYRDKRVLLSLAFVACCGIALLHEMIRQAINFVNGGWIGSIPLGQRLPAVVVQQLLGPSRIATPITLAVDLVVVAAAVLGLVLRPRAARAALPVAGILGAGLAIFVVLMATGHDVLDPRNLLALWLPLGLALSIGLASYKPRLVSAGAVCAMCAAGLVTVVAVDLDSRLQRPDWKGVANVVGDSPQQLLYEVSGCQAMPLNYYLPTMSVVQSTTSVSAFYVLKTIPQPTNFDVLIGDWFTICHPQGAVTLPTSIGGFAATGPAIHLGQFTLQRYVAPTARSLAPATFASLGLGGTLIRP